MSDVHKDNKLRRLDAARKRARLAHSAHEFFTQTDGGKELFTELSIQCGANLPAFLDRDNFNPHSAAYRDGMRASFLIVQNLIEHHKENHEHTTEN